MDVLTMMSAPIESATTVATMMIACFGCSQTQTEPLMQVDELAKTLRSVNLETEAEVQSFVSNAAASERAIMFIHVDWAPMEPQRTRYAQFMLNYQQAHPNDNLLFHYVDCTPITNGYGPLRSLDGWVELESTAGMSLIHGWGELVWLEHGRAIHVERILNFKSTSQLIKKTEALMPLQRGG